MKKKMKMGQTPKWLAVGVAGLLIVGGIYAISNSSSNLAGNNKQLGAVAAGVSSDLSKPKAGGIAAGTSSVQPIINVTTWPNFEMKLGAAGGENNLVAKAEYSITAQGGKIFVPVNWPFLSIKNSLDQYAYPRLTENKSLDAVSIVSCTWGQTCYVIPAGKTIRFTVRQVYEPAQMFGGVYSGKLNWMYFNTVENNNDFYYRAFPAQTSKLNTITIVGEKSPYLYTTAIEATQGQNFTVQGARLNGSAAVWLSNGFDIKVATQTDSGATLVTRDAPGTYRLYFSHPTYGDSNSAWVTVKAATSTTPTLTVTPNYPASPRTQNHKISTSQNVTMQAFNVSSLNGDSMITDVTVNSSSSPAAIPSTLYLYDGPSLVALVPGPTTLKGAVTFKNLGLMVMKDQIKTLDIKATFPSTVSDGSISQTFISGGAVTYRKPDGSSGNSGPSSPIYGNGQWFFTMAPQWTLVSSSNTVTAGIAGVSSSTLTGKITLKVYADGGTFIKPTASNFSILFASSTQKDPGLYNSKNSISVTPTISVTPADSSIPDGGAYTVEITGILPSSDSRFGNSQTLFMAIKGIAWGGYFQTWGVSDFFTTSQYLTKGTL